MDLSQWLEAGRWVHLLDLIEQLPATSRFNAARMNDPDFADMVARLPESDEPWSPELSEFGLTAKQLSEVIDRLGMVVNAVRQSAGGTPLDLKPYPSPVSEIDRARARVEHEYVVEELAKWGFSPDLI